MRQSLPYFVWPGVSKTLTTDNGHSPLWLKLRDFLEKRLGLTADEFNSVSVARYPYK
jgi:hypothetical protein